VGDAGFVGWSLAKLEFVTAVDMALAAMEEDGDLFGEDNGNGSDNGEAVNFAGLLEERGVYLEAV
jgi:hypothetical protein